MEKNEHTHNNSAAIFFVAIAAPVLVLIAGMIAVPAIQEAQAANLVSSRSDKAARGEDERWGKR